MRGEPSVCCQQRSSSFNWSDQANGFDFEILRTQWLSRSSLHESKVALMLHVFFY